LAELENIELLVPAYWQGFENIELLIPTYWQSWKTSSF